jgi:hypothetical protein
VDWGFGFRRTGPWARSRPGALGGALAMPRKIRSGPVLPPPKFPGVAMESCLRKAAIKAPQVVRWVHRHATRRCTAYNAMHGGASPPLGPPRPRSRRPGRPPLSRLPPAPAPDQPVTSSSSSSVGRISWIEAARLGNPLGHRDFFSGRNAGLGLARFSVVYPLGGHMYANGLLWHAGVAGAACMGLTT